MKTITVKNLLMMFVALVLSLGAMAEDDIKGSAPAANARYGLYNVESGQFVSLSGGSLSLSNRRGDLVTLTAADPEGVNTGSYKLSIGNDSVWTTFQGTVGVGNAPANANTKWMFNLVDATEQIYTMGCRDNDANAVDYLYYSTMSNAIAQSYEEPMLGGRWKLVAENDLPWLLVLDEQSANNEIPTDTDPYLVHLKRTFTLNSWNTLCLPFNLTTAQVKDQFGEDVQLVAPGAFIDGTKTLTFYNALKEKDADVSVEAGNTYLVRPTLEPKNSYYSFENISGFVDKPIYQTIAGGVKFTGSFNQTMAPVGKYIIRKNTVYCLTKEMAMKGFRAWFEPVTDSQSPIYFWAIDTDDPTGIDEVFKRKGAVDIYSIGGTLVRQGATSTQGLLKGVYIVDGQKVLVK